MSGCEFEEPCAIIPKFVVFGWPADAGPPFEVEAVGPQRAACPLHVIDVGHRLQSDDRVSVVMVMTVREVLGLLDEGLIAPVDHEGWN